MSEPRSASASWWTPGRPAPLRADRPQSSPFRRRRIGGVLEPLQASPTIIEDDCFIGARSGRRRRDRRARRRFSMGVFIGASTLIIDRESGEITRPRARSFRRRPRFAPGRRRYSFALLRRDRQESRRADPSENSITTCCGLSGGDRASCAGRDSPRSRRNFMRSSGVPAGLAVQLPSLFPRARGGGVLASEPVKFRQGSRAETPPDPVRAGRGNGISADHAEIVTDG